MSDVPSHELLGRYNTLLRKALGKVVRDYTDPLGRVSVPRTELELALSLGLTEAQADLLRFVEAAHRETSVACHTNRHHDCIGVWGDEPHHRCICEHHEKDHA